MRKKCFFKFLIISDASYVLSPWDDRSTAIVPTGREGSPVVSKWQAWHGVARRVVRVCSGGAPEHFN